MTSKPASESPGTAAPPRASGPGRPKDLGKRAAILKSAKRLFVAHGYEGVSMDQIATAAGVSKLTVYSHFGDKDSLFSAAIIAKLDEQVPAALFSDDTLRQTGPKDSREGLHAQLMRIGMAFFSLVSSEEALSMHRMMLSPNSQPHVRDLFWQAGPQRLKNGFGEFLRERMARGQLDIDDVDLAAGQFFCLLKGDLHVRMMCCLCASPAADVVHAHVSATVDMFLRAYGTPVRTAT